jgi:hypothetical protein
MHNRTDFVEMLKKTTDQINNLPIQLSKEKIEMTKNSAVNLLF